MQSIYFSCRVLCELYKHFKLKIGRIELDTAGHSTTQGESQKVEVLLSLLIFLLNRSNQQLVVEAFSGQSQAERAATVASLESFATKLFANQANGKRQLKVFLATLQHVNRRLGIEEEKAA